MGHVQYLVEKKESVHLLDSFMVTMEVVRNCQAMERAEVHDQLAQG